MSLWFKRIASYTGIQGLISNGGIDNNGVNNRSEIIGKYNFITISLQHFGENLLEREQKIPRVYKKRRCDFRSPLMKTLDWSVETLGRECNSTGLCIYFKVAMERILSNGVFNSIAKITYVNSM